MASMELNKSVKEQSEVATVGISEVGIETVKIGEEAANKGKSSDSISVSETVVVSPIVNKDVEMTVVGVEVPAGDIVDDVLLEVPEGDKSGVVGVEETAFDKGAGYSPKDAEEGKVAEAEERVEMIESSHPEASETPTKVDGDAIVNDVSEEKDLGGPAEESAHERPASPITAALDQLNAMADIAADLSLGLKGMKTPVAKGQSSKVSGKEDDEDEEVIITHSTSKKRKTPAAPRRNQPPRSGKMPKTVKKTKEERTIEAEEPQTREMAIIDELEIKEEFFVEQKLEEVFELIKFQGWDHLFKEEEKVDSEEVKEFYRKVSKVQRGAFMTPDAAESLVNSQSPEKASIEKPVQVSGHPPQTV